MTKFVLQAKCDEMAERVMVAMLWGSKPVKGVDGKMFDQIPTNLGSDLYENEVIGDQLDMIRDSLSAYLFKYYTGQTPDLYTDGVINLLESK